MPSTTIASWFAFPHDEPDAANGVNQTDSAFRIDLATESRDLNVDDVVERRRATWLFPHIPREHFAGHQVALMAQEVFEQFELARGQIDQSVCADHPPGDEIQLQVPNLQTEGVGRASPSEERPDPREKLRQREWLDEVIVGAEVEAEHTVV